MSESPITLYQWCNILTLGAAATYLKSLHDASMRAKKGKREAYKNLCRKQGRVRDVSSSHNTP